MIGAVAKLVMGLGLGALVLCPQTNLNPEAKLDASQVEDVRGKVVLQPCTTEDDMGPCFWDSQTRGNKKGEDFISLRNGREGYTTIYVEMTGKTEVKVDGVTYVLDR
jgi:hypothetical protein